MDVHDPATGEILKVEEMPLEIHGEAGPLFAALAKAQSKIRGALRDSTNPHFKSKYADLESTWEACRNQIAENQLAIVQSPYTTNGDVGMVTILGHSSGAYILGRVTVKPLKFDAQGLGSVVTYLRRYSLQSMVGVAPTDDDGNAQAGFSAPQRGDPLRGCITAEQEAELNKLVTDSGADLTRFLAIYRVGTLAELPAAKYEDARAKLNQKLDQKLAGQNAA